MTTPALPSAREDAPTPAGDSATLSASGGTAQDATAAFLDLCGPDLRGDGARALEDGRAPEWLLEKGVPCVRRDTI